MATYIVLGQFTDQGVRNIQDTSQRADAAKEMATTFGAEVRDVFWTIGQYDVVLIVEAPDDKTVMALGMSFGKLGNVRTETLRAFSQAEIREIMKKVV
jgi:uncharacterized protein with GYD domain